MQSLIEGSQEGSDRIDVMIRLFFCLRISSTASKWNSHYIIDHPSPWGGGGDLHNKYSQGMRAEGFHSEQMQSDQTAINLCKNIYRNILGHHWNMTTKSHLVMKIIWGHWATGYWKYCIFISQWSQKFKCFLQCPTPDLRTLRKSGVGWWTLIFLLPSDWYIQKW